MAVEKIQHTYRAKRWNQRAAKFLEAEFGHSDLRHSQFEGFVVAVGGMWCLESLVLIAVQRL